MYLGCVRKLFNWTRTCSELYFANISTFPVNRRPPSSPMNPFKNSWMIHVPSSGFAAYAQPPKPDDGTWIIHEFLKGFIGDDGGRLLTGNVEMLAKYSSEHVLVQLKSFLTQPKYMHYPWRSDWLGIVDPNTRKLWGRLRRNVVFCRDIVKESKLSIPAKETADGKPKHGTWREIGPKKEGW